VVLVRFNKTELECWFTSKYYVKTELCNTPGVNGKRITVRLKWRQSDELRGGPRTVWVQNWKINVQSRHVVEAH